MSCGDLNLIVGNSFIIKHVLKDDSNNPVNDAAVEVTITDQDGNNLAGENWPVSLPYVASSDGIYQRTFNPNDNVDAGKIYVVIIEAIGTDNTTGRWENEVKAKTQGG